MVTQITKIYTNCEATHKIYTNSDSGELMIVKCNDVVDSYKLYTNLQDTSST